VTVSIRAKASHPVNRRRILARARIPAKVRASKK
jgi:hypothetical protein